MDKSVMNSVTGNWISFSGGEREMDRAIMDDEAMDQEYRYEEACHAVGVLPWAGVERIDDGDYPFDQPDA